MIIKTFKSIDGLELVVKSRKSAVIFEVQGDQPDNKYRFSFRFSSEDFLELFSYLDMISNQSWANLIPKVADSLGSDYYEYYDKEFDNNGYLGIKKNELFIERPSSANQRLYQFNKKKMESFIYDFRKIVI